MITNEEILRNTRNLFNNDEFLNHPGWCLLVRASKYLQDLVSRETIQEEIACRYAKKG